MDIVDFSERIETKQDFIKFLGLLLEDLNEKRHEWENDNLENFLEALGGYTEDSNEEIPSWRYFADLLIGASIYE